MIQRITLIIWVVSLTMLIGASSLQADTVVCRHDAPKDLCFICDPSLRDDGRLWCKEHDRYEDHCFDCHHELQDMTRAFCAKHAL